MTPRSPAYWLISRSAGGRLEVFTLEAGGGETLPVFSHGEEARAFLSLGEMGDGWRAAESRTGGVISVLYGPCARVAQVALDPLPEMVADGTVGLTSLPRESFVDLLSTDPGWAWARTG